jgi:CBS domain-containing protein
MNTSTVPAVARDLMVTKLVTLRPDMDVFDAIGLLLKNRISGASVIDEDRTFIGVFSERNCMNALVKAAYDQLPTTALFPFIDTEVSTIDEETDFLTIAQMFRDSHRRRLPVLRDGKLVGQISRRDVLRVAHKMMEVAPDRETALLYLSSLMDRHEAPIHQ